MCEIGEGKANDLQVYFWDSDILLKRFFEIRPTTGFVTSPDPRLQVTKHLFPHSAYSSITGYRRTSIILGLLINKKIPLL